jgi:hypothetical protein
MFTKMIYKLRNNRELTMREWAKEVNLDINVLRYRWNKGFRGEELFKPIETELSYNVFTTYDTGNGEETKTIQDWSEEVGIDRNTLAQRYARGDRGDVLFRRKHQHKKALSDKKVIQDH